MKQSDWFARLVTLNWWSKSEAVLISRLSTRSIWKIYIMFAVVGVSMRLYTQAQPATYMFHAYDFQSYLLVAQSISESENPYSTGRYNYGPIWAIIVWLVRAICGNDDSFRLGLTFVLVVADLGISLWLKKNSYLIASLFILISPISVAITSRHLQFDNLAVLFALLGVSQISRVKSKSVTNQDIWACLFCTLTNDQACFHNVSFMDCITPNISGEKISVSISPIRHFPSVSYAILVRRAQISN